MSELELSLNTLWIMSWIDRMAHRYGGIVRGHGRVWDWGQALRVEQEGADPDKWHDGDPSDADVKRASAWESGHWPEWVEHP